MQTTPIRNKRDVAITSRWSCRGRSLGVERTHGRFLQLDFGVYAASAPSAFFRHDLQALDVAEVDTPTDYATSSGPEVTFSSGWRLARTVRGW